MADDTVILQQGTTRATVLPQRGALVTHFSVEGEELLFLDPTTLADPAKSVRGGIPVLFPIAGKLKDDRFTTDGRSFFLPQHGFARKKAWSVREQGEDFVSLKLSSSEETLKHFPWKFSCTFDIRLSPRTLLLSWTTKNLDAQPLPLHLGFHPYFYVPQAVKAEAFVETQASRAFDNTKAETVPFVGLPLTQREVDLHLLDHGSTKTVLHRGASLKPVKLSWSDAFNTLVVWTLVGRDFVCVEPWTGRGDALNRGEVLPLIAPGEMRTVSFQMGL